ncbi:hypothetical protein BKA70DRAFT_1563351 [Coprinopsis sp. MPI-PUGE-AT-0042]|nr:hypothetical protein BKA70DRAFT_1406455 [Coprinopsis sp. MPI-PUGE-AT-0042]KAH6906961.1 hypothetical protein BKA70DRAFT_1563351 [Coprinopsis sp. MPI-PUGE-AT-0042]
MFKPATRLALLSACAVLAAAQGEVTLYGLSLAPQPSLAAKFNDVLGAVLLGGGNVKASAVAVDPAGATYYVGVQQVSVVPTISSGQLTTITLPTPSAATFTFRADASRIVQEVAIETEASGVKSSFDYELDCTHNAAEDVPEEERTMVCKVKSEVVAEGPAAGAKVESTFEETATGLAIAAVTVTNPANLTLPTGLPTTSPSDKGSASKTSVGMLGLIAAGAAIVSQLL